MYLFLKVKGKEKQRQSTVITPYPETYHHSRFILHMCWKGADTCLEISASVMQLSLLAGIKNAGGACGAIS